jgi:probable selenium-dependent hydroxylase accessory protein YqeC
MPTMTARPLSEVFELARDARVAALGGGGKMTVLDAVGSAWAQAGGRPLLAPTARLSNHEEKGVPGVRTVLLPPARSAWPPITFFGGELVVVGRRGERVGDVEPLTADEIEGIARASGADLTLVKADSTLGRPLVAHAEGEVVLPLTTTLAIAVAGVDAWGAALDETSVRHADRLAERTGAGVGDRIEDDAFYAVLADPAGLRGFVPPGARYAVFLNKVDRPVRVAIAQRIAQGLVERGVGEVLWGDVRRQDWTSVRRGARA